MGFSAGCTTTVCVPRVPIWTQPLPVISIDSVAGVMVSIVAFQAVDPGSIPGRRSLFFSGGENRGSQLIDSPWQRKTMQEKTPKKNKKIKKRILRSRELNPGLLRDRQEY